MLYFICSTSVILIKVYFRSYRKYGRIISVAKFLAGRVVVYIFCIVIVKKVMKRHNALGTAVGAIVAVLHPQNLIKYSFCNRQ